MSSCFYRVKYFQSIVSPSHHSVSRWVTTVCLFVSPQCVFASSVSPLHVGLSVRRSPNNVDLCCGGLPSVTVQWFSVWWSFVCVNSTHSLVSGEEKKRIIFKFHLPRLPESESLSASADSESSATWRFLYCVDYHSPLPVLLCRSHSNKVLFGNHD